jgi:hypothetical protein
MKIVKRHNWFQLCQKVTLPNLEDFKLTLLLDSDLALLLDFLSFIHV